VRTISVREQFPKYFTYDQGILQLMSFWFNRRHGLMAYSSRHIRRVWLRFDVWLRRIHRMCHIRRVWLRFDVRLRHIYSLSFSSRSGLIANAVRRLSGVSIVAFRLNC
jgi:hypothetical protein